MHIGFNQFMFVKKQKGARLDNTFRNRDKKPSTKHDSAKYTRI